MSPRLETVYFGSGCFRRKRELFGELHGVVEARAGYMGGWTANPSAEQVASKTTGHTEVVEVTFDTQETKLTALLKAFFSFHDATVDHRHDGSAYRSIVFCRKAKQRIVTERAVDLLRGHGLLVATEVKDARLFWLAEIESRSALPSRTGQSARVWESMSLLEAASLKRAESRALARAG